MVRAETLQLCIRRLHPPLASGDLHSAFKAQTHQLTHPKNI